MVHQPSLYSSFSTLPDYAIQSSLLSGSQQTSHPEKVLWLAVTQKIILICILNRTFIITG